MRIRTIEFNLQDDFERFIKNIRLLQEVGKDPRDNLSRAFEGVCVCVDTDTCAIYATIDDGGIAPYQSPADAINILPETDNEEQLFKTLNDRLGPSVLEWARRQIEILEEEAHP